LDDSGIGKVEQIELEVEMGEAYLDYAMSTIVSRAIPDVRDGLKPVQRRILYAMQDLGARATSQYRKCARIVGETMGKYHPHGDSAIYDALARMAQPFSLRYMLVDGQGNFGSVDGDPPAAMRYTEARLSRLAEIMLADIDRDTVDFVDNFDATAEMPEVLPARLPNLLVNGATGIAVGMATNMPPHNLREVADAVIRLIDEPDLSFDDLTKIVTGPDFPTHGIIGADGVREAYSSGRGRVIVRGRVGQEEDDDGRIRLIISELPYQVNKSTLVEKIADLVRGKTIEGVSNLRDESDRDGMRVVIELKRDAHPLQVQNLLFKHTSLQTTFGVNMVCLVGGQPRTLGLRDILTEFIRHRETVITRRASFDLNRATEREHLLLGFLTALDNIDEVVELIRNAETTDDARDKLSNRFELTEVQANAVLDMQLRRLVALEAQKLRDELTEVQARIAELTELLGDITLVHKVLKEETLEIRERFGDDRRTTIVPELSGELALEDLVPDEDCVVTITRRGYTKRQPLTVFRTQGRGGKGIRGLAVKEDEITHFLTTHSHDHLLFFTNRGRAYRLRCYEIPMMGRDARGIALINIIQLEPGESISAPLAIENFEAGESLIMGTANGEVKRTALTRYVTVRKKGLLAMDLDDDDELGWVRLSDGDNGLMFFTRLGMAIHFHEQGVRSSGRTSGGVRGIRLNEGDQVISVDLTSEGDYVLVVTENGYGKKMPVKEFRRQSRGGKGLKAIGLKDKTGPVVAARIVSDPDQDIMLLSTQGRLIRLSLSEVRPMGRYAAGMIVMRLNKGELVAGLAVSGDGRDDQDMDDIDDEDEAITVDAEGQEIDEAEAGEQDSGADDADGAAE
jgi:DNA gyrase subunit A